MLHYAQDLAASPPVLYKFIVGRRTGASLFVFCRPTNSKPSAHALTVSGVLLAEASL